MPQYSQKPTNNFVGGLLTEAGELTFPDNASIDESNCDLLRDGSRRRRLGIVFEDGYELHSEIVQTDDVISTHRWANVGEDSSVEFIVVQLGATVMFFESTSAALSSTRVDTTFSSGTEYSLDLSTYERAGSAGAETVPIQVASVRGALVIASAEIDTILVERNTTTGAFTVTTIDFRVRDYEWQGDYTTYDSQLASGSTGQDRVYDTKNAGWSDGPNGIGDSALSTYISSQTAYPPLTHPWYAGKNASGAFAVSEFELIYAGTSLITNGHYLYDLFDKDRETAASLSVSTYNTTETARFSTVAAYAGRVFYSGMGDSTDGNGTKVYFSQQLVSGLETIGDCHQVNDPTSEELSDLLDTDGGFIDIPEVRGIKKLHSFGPDLYVFAENGVWRIGGVDDVFRATDYTVSKLTDDGLLTIGAFVSAQGRPYWWSYAGIFTLRPNQVGTLVAENISVSTIQTRWESIGNDERLKVQGAFDPNNRRVVWLYPSDGETVSHKKNEILIFDEVLTAFVPWSIADQAVGTDYMVDAIYPGVNNVSDLTASNDSSKLKFLVIDGTNITFAEFTDTGFLDWGEANYSSYAESAYNFMGDLETRKTVPYITSYLKSTETGWELNDAGDGYEPIRDSSCILKAYWDFKTDPSGTGQQVYRRKRTPAVDTGDLSSFNYPRTMVISRVKVRGRGRVVRLRWESEEGKDFHLVGFNVLSAGNERF